MFLESQSEAECLLFSGSARSINSNEKCRGPLDNHGFRDVVCLLVHSRLRSIVSHYEVATMNEWVGDEICAVISTSAARAPLAEQVGHLCEAGAAATYILNY